jgi:starch synthase
MMSTRKLLFVASEAFPLIKTGGLADVAGSLPEVLRQKGMDVRLLLPGYADILKRLRGVVTTVAKLDVEEHTVRILECQLPGTALPTWLIDHPFFSTPGGNPYQDANGDEWPDNADRFLLLSRVAAAISTRDTALEWRPDILHCNDWHTGPAIALVHQAKVRPRTVFTIHNLAHMGIFDRATFERLGLPDVLWQEQGMEFYNQCSFIKAGLVFADHITTVSPTYAREICSAPGGMGLEGLLRRRQDRLIGILNGIDTDTWDPAKDQFLAHPYDANSLQVKTRNKSSLQHELGLPEQLDRPLLGFVGRLAEQKGLELLLPALEEIIASPTQVVILGKGDPNYEQRLQALAAAHPESVAMVLAYDEGLAHRIEAAADIFLMPSLFEPCGLNQLYSLRYGTLPVVRAVGGLADTVVDANEHNLRAQKATGFVFQQPTSTGLLEAVRRAIKLWHDTSIWQSLQSRAMSMDFSWHRSADKYLELYSSASD